MTTVGDGTAADDDAALSKYVARWKALTSIGNETLSQLSVDLAALRQVDSGDDSDDDSKSWGALAGHATLPALVVGEFRQRLRDAVADLKALMDKFAHVRRRVGQLVERARQPAGLPGSAAHIWRMMSADEAVKHAIVVDIEHKKLSFTTLLYYIDTWQTSPLFNPF